MRVAVVLLGLVAVNMACNIIVHVKSDTDKKFQAQVTASNGKKSDRWTYSKKLDRNTFQQKADECGVKPWDIAIFNADGTAAHTAKITLDGTGTVTYKIGDDLIPKMKSRQGAICKGECAPLA